MSANPTKILVVDDEPQIRRLLRTSLVPQKFEIAEASTAAAALKLLAADAFDLVILDLGLPDRSGIEVISEIRAMSQVPIIVLSVRNDEAGKVKALELGADDYITKPFGMAELVMRIRVALRHRYQAQGTLPVLRAGDLEIDLVNRKVSRGGTEIKLSPTEYDIVRLLAEHAGKILTHDYILRRVWGDDKADDVQYLRVYVRAIRKKLGDRIGENEIIRTEMGIGYRLLIGEP
ncbi:MAG TPA: response regulator transcription factor [Alphaproteobacteria bacterium]|nr:response regulator transcription factor [Alphaproteobacteria bacterium]